MPTYDYRCECGNEFEDLVPISEREFSKCPACGRKAHKLEVGYGTPGVVTTTSPSKPSISGRPPDAIPIGETGYAVPRRDKRGNPVKLKDLKGRNDLPPDMQKLWDKKSEKDRRMEQAAKDQRGTKATIKKHHEGKFNKK